MLVFSQSYTERLPYGFIEKSNQQVHLAHHSQMSGLQQQCWSGSQKVGSWMHTRGVCLGLRYLHTPFLRCHGESSQDSALGGPARSWSGRWLNALGTVILSWNDRSMALSRLKTFLVLLLMLAVGFYHSLNCWPVLIFISTRAGCYILIICNVLTVCVPLLRTEWVASCLVDICGQIPCRRHWAATPRARIFSKTLGCFFFQCYKCKCKWQS